MKKLFLLSIIVFATSVAFAQKMTAEEYIETYSNWAVEEMQRVGIPASITLAQGLLESGFGNSRLATEGNNHFGIKCHKGWTGEKMYEDDDAAHECFRKYKSAYESFKDHSDFLTTRSRYAFLFELDSDDYKGWAKGLKKAGYATNPQYANKLIELIERYELFRFDDENYTPSFNKPDKLLADNNNDNGDNDVRKVITPGFSDDWVIDPYNRKVYKSRYKTYIITRGGDNALSLAQEFGMEPWQIYRYNDLNAKTDKIQAGQIIHLTPKHNQAEKGKDVHIVKEGETLWSISQIYGVKLNKLCKLNHISKTQKLTVGSKIYLRKKGSVLNIL